MITRQNVLYSLVESFGKTTEFLSPILLSTVLTTVLPQIIRYLPKYLTHWQNQFEKFRVEYFQLSYRNRERP